MHLQCQLNTFYMSKHFKMIIDEVYLQNGAEY